MLPKPSNERNTSDIAGALAYPIVTYLGWGSVSKTLKQDIVTARMIQAVQAYRNGTDGFDYAPDEEAMVYLSTACHAAPLSREWYQIYLNLFCGYLERKGREVPPDIQAARHELSDYEKHLLRSLKKRIRKEQRKAVKAGDRQRG